MLTVVSCANSWLSSSPSNNHNTFNLQVKLFQCQSFLYTKEKVFLNLLVCTQEFLYPRTLVSWIWNFSWLDDLQLTNHLPFFYRKRNGSQDANIGDISSISFVAQCFPCCCCWNFLRILYPHVSFFRRWKFCSTSITTVFFNDFTITNDTLDDTTVGEEDYISKMSDDFLLAILMSIFDVNSF